MSETAKAYDAAAAEPMPVGNGIDVAVVAAEKLKELGLNEIAEDIEARIRLGERKYGTRLKAFNGRNAWMDAYQEALDGVNYAAQVQIEGLDNGELFNKFVDITVYLAKKVRGQ